MNANPAGSVSDFEQLYRTQLRELYRLLGVAPPALLDVPKLDFTKRVLANGATLYAIRGS